MKSEKLCISIDGELAEIIRSASAAEGRSVSSWMAQAAKQFARGRALREALDVDAQENGTLSIPEIDALIVGARQNSRVSGLTKRQS